MDQRVHSEVVDTVLHTVVPLWLVEKLLCVLHLTQDVISDFGVHLIACLGSFQGFLVTDTDLIVNILSNENTDLNKCRGCCDTTIMLEAQGDSHPDQL